MKMGLKGRGFGEPGRVASSLHSRQSGRPLYGVCGGPSTFLQGEVGDREDGKFSLLPRTPKLPLEDALELAWGEEEKGRYLGTWVH